MDAESFAYETMKEESERVELNHLSKVLEDVAHGMSKELYRDIRFILPIVQDFPEPESEKYIREIAMLERHYFATGKFEMRFYTEDGVPV